MSTNSSSLLFNEVAAAWSGSMNKEARRGAGHARATRVSSRPDHHGQRLTEEQFLLESLSLLQRQVIRRNATA